MSLLTERLEQLEADLTAVPARISTYHDLPFAIVRYDPSEEWDLRRALKLLATRLGAAGKEVVTISLATLLWRAIEESEGIEAVAELERDRGFPSAQEQVGVYLSDAVWRPLPDLVAAALAPLDPARHVAFLVRAPALAPASYQLSRLLDEMKGRTRVHSILFYPGGIEGTHGLRFMSLPDREPMGNYRVKIYG